MSIADKINAAKPAPAKILVIDIERLPGLARAFDPRTNYIPARNWVEWPSLLCFAARWYDQKRPEFYSVWDDAEQMVERSWQLYDEADIIVTYNGIRFDNKHLRSEWLMAGFPPPRTFKDVDLFAVNKRLFGFESKSLDTLAGRLGLGGKVDHYDMDLAFAAVSGDEKAQRRMKRYNIGDVALTARVYDALKAWVPNHPHVGIALALPQCNRCAGFSLTEVGVYRTPTYEYPEYRCDDCGGLLRGTKSLSRISTRHGVV